MIGLRRAYAERLPRRGKRFLVDGVWPRGVTKERLRAAWVRDVAPSAALRRWFDHRPERFEEFRRRYVEELEGNPEAWAPLLEAAREGDVVLLFGARDEEHNHAVVLKDYLERELEKCR